VQNLVGIAAVIVWKFEIFICVVHLKTHIPAPQKNVIGGI